MQVTFPAAPGRIAAAIKAAARRLVGCSGLCQTPNTNLAASLVVLGLLLGSVAPASAAATAKARGLTLYVTDRGIDQMKGWDAGKESGLTWAMSQLDPGARIAVVMPRGDDFDNIPAAVLRRNIFNDLKTRIDEARRSGHSTLEIQLVEDVNRPGYFAPWRQDTVDRFGAAAYGAISDINAYLARQDVKVANRANLGSNGTKVFAANVDAWTLAGKAIWDSVDMFDGRAFLPQMVKAIDRIGPGRVRIFNTTWDWWAPRTLWASSVGNAATAQQLKDEYFPPLKVYKLTSMSKEFGHVSGMSDSNRFLVEEYVSKAKGLEPLPHSVLGSELRRPAVLPKATARAAPPDLPEGVAIWRSTAQDLVGALSTFADDFAAKPGAKNPMAATVKGLGRGTALTQALLEDIAQSGEGPAVVLKSRSLEELVKFAMDDAAESLLAKSPALAPYMKDMRAYKELYSALMETVRAGKIGTETMQSFDRGVLELAKRQMTERHAAEMARSFKVAQLERQVALTERNLQRVTQAASMGGGIRDIDRARSNELRALTRRYADQSAELESARGAAKAAEARFTQRLMLLDALPELAGAMAEHAKRGRMTVDVVDRYSDAVITLSASYIAGNLAVVPVLAPYAPTVRDAVVASSRYARDNLTREPIQNLHNFLAGDKWKVLEQYQVYQNRAVRGSQPLKTFSEIYGADDLKKLGFSNQEIARQDEHALQLNRARAHPRPEQTMPAPPLPPLANADPKERVAERRRIDETPSGQQSASPPPPPPCAPGAGTCGGIDLGLSALVIDPGTRKIVTLTEGGVPSVESLDPNLMALALLLEYTNQTAAFSLDPYDPKDPKGRWLRAVYLPDALRGTVAGNQCFDADFRGLKQMSFGVRVDGERLVEHHSASGLKSIPLLMSEQSGTVADQWSRLWIVSRAVRLLAGDGIVRVEFAKMGVEARRQVPDPTTRTGLRDVATPGDAIEQRFARQFELLYDQLAASEAPSLAAVREMTKAIALARWLKLSGVRIDMDAVVTQLNRERVAAVDKVTALSVGWSSESRTPFSGSNGSGVRTTTRTLHVFGGVDLAVDPKSTVSTKDAPLREAVVSKLRQANGATRFELAHAGRHYRAYVMPFEIIDARAR